MKQVIVKIVGWLTILLLSSCGYHLGDSSLSRSYRNVFISFIEGDLDGRLTSEIILHISAMTSHRYVSDENKADVILKGRIIKHEQMNIGYQYDVRESTQGPINRLVPNEARKEVVVEVTFLDPKQHFSIKGPYVVQAFADYDFVNSDTYKALSFIDTAGVPQSVLRFSLGQLDSPQGASDVALNVAYKYLAIKIAQGLEKL